jgi:hypothetical protein
MSDRLKRLIPWLVVALGPLTLFGPMLVRGEALVWGTPLLQFVPWRTFAIETLRQGHLPLWNPWLGMGAPLLANYQSALLYPPNFLLAITGPAWGQGLLVMLHLIWAGAGMIVLTRRLGLGSLAQIVAALAYSLSGYVVARASFLSINAATAWLPWVIAGADRLAGEAARRAPRGRIAKAMVVLGLVLGLQWLSGHAQMAWYSAVLMALWILWRAYGLAKWPGVGRAAMWTMGAGLLAAALAAAQLIPTAEYLAVSSRQAGVDTGFALTYSFWPWRFLGLLMPGVFGNPAHGDYWGYGAYWEDAIYVGVLPFLLALVGAVRAMLGGERRSLTLFLACIGLGAGLLALGKNTPIFPFLFRYVPTFGLFQAPARWNLLLVFALALLAGLGAEVWRSPSGRGLYWLRLGTVGAAVVGISSWALGPLIGGIQPTFLQAFALAGVGLLASALLALFRPKQGGRAWASLVVALVLADLVYAGIGLNPSAPLSTFSGEGQLARSVSKDHRLYMPSDLEYDLTFDRLFRLDTFHPGVDWSVARDMGLPNTPLLDGLSSVDNFDPLLSAGYTAWMERLEALPGPEQERLLRLMGVGYRAVPDPAQPSGTRYEAVADASRLRIVPQAEWADAPGEALDRTFADDFDPDGSVVLVGVDRQEVTRVGGPGEATLVDQRDPNSVSVDVRAPAGGWLVLSDAWYPGWRATLDGLATRLYRADYLFRSVWVPPGNHTVTFEYRPVSFWAGAALSLMAWLALGWMGWRWRRG